MRSIVRWSLAGLLGITLIFWFLTRPAALTTADLPDHQPDRVNGELVFHTGGCASCHEAGLGGGLELDSEFGVFRVPNISSDPVTGIGGWTALEFVNAMMRGISPGGEHYYPAFPYTSYSRMRVEDILDLKAYMDSLAPVSLVVAPHELGFPWNIRRGIGLWKTRYFDPAPVNTAAFDDPAVARGQYLAEGAGHCGECHTPRDRFGGMLISNWLTGAVDPDGEGRVPNITPHADGLKSWTLSDIAYYLESGFTPDYDTVGGSMVKVQENLARLPDSDRKALAAYLKAIPPRPDPLD